MSKTLARAAAACVSSAKSLCFTNLHASPGRPPCLDSKSLLELVQQVRHFSLDDTVLYVPGAAVFLARACILSRVHISCTKLADSARFDRLLMGCQNISSLSCTGTYLPAIFPASLKELRFHSCFRSQSGDAGLDSNSILEQLVVRLNTWGVSLQVLDLCLGPRLACKEQLPELQKLRLVLHWSGNPDFDFTWLQEQPCLCLDIVVRLGGPAPGLGDLYAALVAQLQQLRHLHLTVYLRFDAREQKIWQQLSSASLVTMSVEDAGEVIALPDCPIVHLRQGPKRLLGPWVIRWEALADRPRRIQLTINRSRTAMQLRPPSVEVLGCPAFGTMPFADEAEPWQLAVFNCAMVSGLPPSQPCKAASYFLQNRAAVLAGWTEDTFSGESLV